MKKDIFDQIRDQWPSPVVASAKVEIMTGGIVSGKTFANMRCKGEPVPESTLVGRRRVYIVESVIEWLRNRVQVCGDQA